MPLRGGNLRLKNVFGRKFCRNLPMLHGILFASIEVMHSEDCFYYCSERNNVVVLFETLKVQCFILTEVSDCGLLIIVTSSTFLNRKDMLKEKTVSPRSHPAS